MKRKTDGQSKAHFRTDRMFEQGGEWYIRIRDGDVMGPFANEVEAINQLEVYIRQSESGLLPAATQVVRGKKLSANNAG